MATRLSAFAASLAILIGIAVLGAALWTMSGAAPHAVSQPPAVVDPELIGTYYFGDGLGVNQELVLQEDGEFSCKWTGCLGDYGTTDGDWSRDGERVLLHANSATGMFVDSPLTELKVLIYKNRPHLVEQGWDSFIAEFGEESIPRASFSPKD